MGGGPLIQGKETLFPGHGHSMFPTWLLDPSSCLLPQIQARALASAPTWSANQSGFFWLLFDYPCIGARGSHPFVSC